MRLTQSALVLLATNLLVSLINQPANAFYVTYATNRDHFDFTTQAPYTLADGRKGSTYLDPRLITELKLGGTNDFLKMLDNDPRWQGWTFTPSNKDLYGDFEILNYYGCGAQTNCGKEKIDKGWNISGGVGAYIDINYYAQKSDPQPGEGTIHWIQRVVNNHSLLDEQQISSGGGVHGLRYDGIDIPINLRKNSFYDTVASANEYSFQDRPYRPDADQKHSWYAELYLVEETAPKEVTIYNGIRWGWKNRVYPKRDPICKTQDIDSNGNCVPDPISPVTQTFDVFGPINYTAPANTSIKSFTNIGGSWNAFNPPQSQLGDPQSCPGIGLSPNKYGFYRSLYGKNTNLIKLIP